MNCHHHDFVGGLGGSTSHTRAGNQAMSEIVIQHNTNQPLTTAYAVHAQQSTPEQRQKRESQAAMAKAQALTRLYGGTATTTTTTTKTRATTVNNNPQNLPVAQPVLQYPQTAIVTAAPIPAPAPPARRRGTASEPGFLALNGTFRKSSSSLLAEDNLSGGSNHSNITITKQGAEIVHSVAAPAPPPLKTEVTSLLLNPSKPQLNAEVTNVITNPPQQQQPRMMPGLKPPPVPGTTARKQPAPRRPSDSVTSISTTRQQYKERPSFQAHDSLTSSSSSASHLPSSTNNILPKKPTPNIYPNIVAYHSHHGDTAVTHRSSTNTESGGGLLRGLAIEEQAHMLKRYQEEQQQQHYHGSRVEAIATSRQEDSRTLAVQEQEKLLQQFSQNHHHHHHGPTTSPQEATARGNNLSPQEEQAKLWDQIVSDGQRQRTTRRDPLEEQAQMLEAYKRTANPRLSAVEEQERMLREFQAAAAAANKRQTTTDPIQEQAKRLREIQDAKEKRVMEMACRISQADDRRQDDHDQQQHEEELSLQYIMEMSRREAEQHSRAQQDLERAVLQEALQRSQQDIGGGSNSSITEEQLRQHEQSVDLELRRSIAELACQSSERTLETSAHGHHRWGVATRQR